MSRTAYILRRLSIRSGLKNGGGGRLMSQWKKITIRVMRYVTLLLIVGFVALLLIYTSGSNRPFEKVEKSVEASLDKEI